MLTPDLVQLLREKAAAASAVLVELPSMTKALEYVVTLCEEKAPCLMLTEEAGAEKGPVDAESGLHTRTGRILAAPDLPKADFAAFQKLCKAKGWNLLRTGIREYQSGIDISVNVVPHVIADSATCIMMTTLEETLLSSALCEINVLIVPVSGMLADLTQAAPILRDFMQSPSPTGGHYTSFITGPSRTADIEQVLAIGVHGPLALHIILVEG